MLGVAHALGLRPGAELAHHAGGVVAAADAGNLAALHRDDVDPLHVQLLAARGPGVPLGVTMGPSFVPLASPSTVTTVCGCLCARRPRIFEYPRCDAGAIRVTGGSLEPGFA